MLEVKACVVFLMRKTTYFGRTEKHTGERGLPRHGDSWSQQPNLLALEDYQNSGLFRAQVACLSNVCSLCRKAADPGDVVI
jgi:hypothetical protein